MTNPAHTAPEPAPEMRLIPTGKDTELAKAARIMAEMDAQGVPGVVMLKRTEKGRWYTCRYDLAA